MKVSNRNTAVETVGSPSRNCTELMKKMGEMPPLTILEKIGLYGGSLMMFSHRLFPRREWAGPGLVGLTTLWIIGKDYAKMHSNRREAKRIDPEDCSKITQIFVRDLKILRLNSPSGDTKEKSA